MRNKKRILFVCVENSNRSQLAEAFARIQGGSDVEVYSAGSRPSGQINPKAMELLQAFRWPLFPPPVQRGFHSHCIEPSDYIDTTRSDAAILSASILGVR